MRRRVGSASAARVFKGIYVTYCLCKRQVTLAELRQIRTRSLKLSTEPVEIAENPRAGEPLVVRNEEDCTLVLKAASGGRQVEQ